MNEQNHSADPQVAPAVGGTQVAVPEIRRCFGYIVFGDSDALAPTRQLSMIKRYAARTLGAEIVRWYWDGVGTTEQLGRPGLVKLLAAAEGDEFTDLIVDNQLRLKRHPSAFRDIFDVLERAGIQLHDAARSCVLERPVEIIFHLDRERRSKLAAASRSRRIKRRVVAPDGSSAE